MRIFQNPRAYFTRIKILTLGRGCGGLTAQSTRQLCENKPSSFVALFFPLSLFRTLFIFHSFLLSFTILSNDSFIHPVIHSEFFRINLPWSPSIDKESDFLAIEVTYIEIFQLFVTHNSLTLQLSRI